MPKQFQNTPVTVWYIPIAMLILALMPVPYGYYTLLKITVCFTAGFLAYIGFQQDDENKNVHIGMLLMAVLYNPLVPIYLSREIWGFLNLLSSLAFASHWYFFKRGLNS